MEGFLSAIIVALITTVVQWRISKKEQDIRENERRDKFRLSALDKRFDIHQEAFYRWNKMTQLIHENAKQKNDYLVDCQEWYYKNCLYLDTESRLEFKMCINNVSDYRTFWENWKESNRSIEEHNQARYQLKFIFERIQKTGEFIAKGIDINYKSIKDFDKDESDKAMK